MTIINLYYIRHGHACNNVVSFFDEEYKIVNRDINGLNSLLTNHGTEQAKHVNKLINIKPDLILTSDLVRTIETGLLVFQNIIDKIYVSPFIAETNKIKINSKRNIDIDKVKQYVENNYPNSIYPLVNFEILEYFKKIGDISPNENKLFSELIPYLIKKFNLSNNSNVVVISHGGFIHKHFLKRHGDNIPKPQNLEIRKEIISYEEDKTVKFIKYKLYKPKYKNKHIRDLDEKDVTRCYLTLNGPKFKNEFKICKIDGSRNFI